MRINIKTEHAMHYISLTGILDEYVSDAVHGHDILTTECIINYKPHIWLSAGHAKGHKESSLKVWTMSIHIASLFIMELCTCLTTFKEN
jgi:hypothetical protein